MRGVSARPARSLPGVGPHEDAGVAWVDSGLPDSSFNFVYRAPSDADALAARVAGVREHFERRRVAFHWCVGLRVEPAGLVGVLTRFRPARAFPG